MTAAYGTLEEKAAWAPAYQDAQDREGGVGNGNGILRPVDPLADDTHIAYAVSRANAIYTQLKALNRELDAELEALTLDEKETRRKLDKLRRAVLLDFKNHTRAKTNGARHQFWQRLKQLGRFRSHPDNRDVLAEIHHNIRVLEQTVARRRKDILDEYLAKRQKILETTLR